MDRQHCYDRCIDRRELLYNETTLSAMLDEYGRESEIKRFVKTSATVYEIRSALKYWFGLDDGEPRRISKRIVDACAAVDQGADPNEVNA